MNVWIPERHLKTQTEIENFSKFVQLCLDDVVGIMTWAILKQEDPEKYQRPNQKPLEAVLPEFNKAYPLDPLTAKRLGKKQWPKNSPNKPELW